MDIDDLEINTPLGWDDEDEKEQNGRCVLCEYADDAGSAMSYLKQLDTALGGRTSDGQLGKMMEESYNTYFADPMRKRNVDVPSITASEMMLHFTEHDINPLRLLRRDINNLKSIQIPCVLVYATRRAWYFATMRMRSSGLTWSV